MDTKICGWCGKEFGRTYLQNNAKWAARRFCSNRCSSTKGRTFVFKPCLQCGEVYERPRGISDKVWSSRRFCSQKCGYKKRTKHVQ